MEHFRSRMPLHIATLVTAALVVAPAGARAAAPAASAGGAKKAPAHAVVPFIDDDLERAKAEAKSRELPLFVESWAPW